MKHSILTISILMALSLVFFSCSDDDDPVQEEQKGRYKVIMDGQVIAEGSDGKVGFVQGGEGGAWTISISKGEEISLLLSAVPTETGSTATIDGSDVTVSVAGSLVKGSYLTPVGSSGTITRVSDSKFTFICTCKDLEDWVGSPTYLFEGSIESDAYKVVK